MHGSIVQGLQTPYAFTINLSDFNDVLDLAPGSLILVFDSNETLGGVKAEWCCIIKLLALDWRNIWYYRCSDYSLKGLEAC